MQANQFAIESRTNLEQTNESFVAGKVSGWIGRMFGCRHKEMSRPFSSEGQTYRACVHCGARRSFNLGAWEMRGDFYYSLPTGRHFRAINGLPPRPAKRSTTISGIAPARRQYA